MSTITVVDNEFITLWYHPEDKIVHHRFHKKTIYGEHLRNAFSKGVDLLKENNAKKWLSDDRENIIFTEEDTEWFLKDWFPRAVESGWQFWALVQPQQIIGKINLEQFTNDYSKKGIMIKLFDNLDSAKEWLTCIE